MIIKRILLSTWLLNSRFSPILLALIIPLFGLFLLDKTRRIRFMIIDALGYSWGLFWYLIYRILCIFFHYD